MTRMRIANCHQASIIKDPCDEELYEDVVATLDAGTEISVDTTIVYWNWKDQTYYKCKWGYKEDEGYINTGLVEVI